MLCLLDSDRLYRDDEDQVFHEIQIIRFLHGLRTGQMEQGEIDVCRDSFAYLRGLARGGQLWVEAAKGVG